LFVAGQAKKERLGVTTECRQDAVLAENDLLNQQKGNTGRRKKNSPQKEAAGGYTTGPFVGSVWERERLDNKKKDDNSLGKLGFDR